MNALYNDPKLENIQKQTQQLWNVVCKEEEAMLGLGTEVQTLAEKASLLQKNVSNIYSAFQGGKGDSDSLGKIGKLVQECLQNLEQTLASLNARRSVMDHSAQNVRALQRRCESLEKAAHYFNVLALNMKIQAATVDGGIQLFEGMVTSTKHLSEDISGAKFAITSVAERTLDEADPSIRTASLRK